MRAPGGQTPFHPSLARIRIVLHIETERKPADRDPIADDRAPLISLDHVGRSHVRVKPRMAAIVCDDVPHLLGRGPYNRDGGAATGRFARAGWQLIGHNHLACRRAATYIL